MIFDLQPPSPSLSPNSKTRFYQDQLDKAHEIIDQLEILLQQKEHQKQFPQTTYNNIQIPTLQLNKKLTDIIGDKSKSYVTTPLQYSTPRDRRTRLPLGGQTSARYIEEIKSRHSELILQYKEDNIQKEQKNKELNDQIQELKSELMFCQEKQSMTKKEKKQTEHKLDSLENQIQSIQMQLLQSKERGKNLKTKIIEINQVDNILKEEENKKEYQCNSDSQQQQLKEENSNPQMGQKFQQKNSHKKLLGSLQKEIQQLENKKQEIYNQTTTTLFEEKQIQCKEYQFNDRQNLINDFPQNQNIVLASESGVLLNTFTEGDINSIKSFRSKGNQKNRSCESCQIF